jgi:hypothetical protein
MSTPHLFLPKARNVVLQPPAGPRPSPYGYPLTEPSLFQPEAAPTALHRFWAWHEWAVYLNGKSGTLSKVPQGSLPDRS